MNAHRCFNTAMGSLLPNTKTPGQVIHQYLKGAGAIRRDRNCPLRQGNEVKLNNYFLKKKRSDIRYTVPSLKVFAVCTTA
jgi:hypothetical protein